MLSFFVAVKTLLNGAALMIPDMTPSFLGLVDFHWKSPATNLRSYPKSKKPMVAVADTAAARGFPDMPAYVGAMMGNWQRRMEESDQCDENKGGF